MPTELTRKLMRILGYTSLFPPQQQALDAGVEQGDSILLASPTASGKTFIAMAGIINTLRREGGRAFYTVPLRSIASMIYRDFRVLERLGFTVKVSIGDYTAGAPRADIVVTTYEKLDSMIRNQPGILEEMRVVVIDEIHYVGEAKRGPLLETTIAKILTLASPQIIGLSATVPNAKEIAEWIGAKPVISDWRPVPLKEGVYKNGVIHWVTGDEHKVEAVTGTASIDLAVDASRQGGPSIVFVQSRRRAMTLSQKAKRIGRKLAYDERKAREYAKKLMDSGGPKSLREDISELVKNGVAFHHAGLNNEQRTIIEEAFREGAISVIFATPTLAAGVNLPAYRVIVDEYYRFEAGMRRPIAVAEYKQLAGRAGRPGYHGSGEAVIVASSGDYVDELIEDYILAEPEPVRSRLSGLRGLRHSILGIIASRIADDLKGVVDVHKRTLFARSIGVERLAPLMARAIEDLAEWGLVNVDGDNLGVTLLGLETAKTYMDPEDVPIARSMLPRVKGHGELGLLYLITNLPDMVTVTATRRDEEYLMERLLEDETGIDDLIDWLGPEEARRLKTAFILYDWVNEAREDELYERYNIAGGDLAALIDTGEWLAESLSRIAPLLGFGEVEGELRILSKRIRYGVRRELLELVSLPGVGRVRARILYKAGYKSLADIAMANVSDLLRIPGIGRETVKRIMEHLGRGEEVQSIAGESIKSDIESENVREGLLAFMD